MAYTTIAAVQGLMAQFDIGSGSRPTTGQVEVIVAEHDAEVNAHIAAAGYGVPITAPDYFVTWLGNVVNYGSVAAILKSMFPSAIGPGETPAYAFWEARYRAALKAIDDGTMIPDDGSVVPGPIAGGHLVSSTYFTRNPSAEETLGDIAEPWFKREMTF